MHNLKALGATALQIDITNEAGNASPPSVVAKVVSKALRADWPRTRYVVGKFAKLLIFLRKWFGDRIFDTVIMRAT